MAKKKNPEEIADVANEAAPIVESAETTEPNPVEEPTPSVPETAEEPTPETVEDKEPEMTAEPKTLPTDVEAYLKRHPEVDAVYFNKQGGIFPKNTAKVFLKDATLYQNPYFKQ